MDDSRFDAVTRAITVRLSRRTGLGLLTSLGAIGLALPDSTEAKKKPVQKISVCHKGKTIEIDKKKKKQHLKHGDTIGKCPCRTGKKPCAGACIPNADCCTNAECSGGDLCTNGDCVAPRCGTGGACTVFMTNAGFVGSDLNGLTGADAACQSAAQTAGLTGTFKAWLSAGADSPATRFTNLANAGPYRLVLNGSDGANGPPLVANDFTDLTTCNGGSGECLQHAIDRTEDGVTQGGNPAVWTGTLPDGTTGSETCGGWTSAGNNGTFGIGTSVDAIWTNSLFSSCVSPLALYCFQQA